MGYVVRQFVIAGLLIAAGVACWSEATVSLRIAEARRQLATLRYPSSDDLAGARSVTSRIPGRVGAVDADIRRHGALVRYWTSRYPEMVPSTEQNGADAKQSDADVLFLDANAAFRTWQQDSQREDRQVGVNKLDSVLQAYSSVLKAAPRYPDAAYNYEYVARVRDAVANGRPLPPEKEEVAPAGAASDLPQGLTPHGRPGGAPAAAKMEEFQVVTPKRGDERGSEPGRNPAERPRRRG